MLGRIKFLIAYFFIWVLLFEVARLAFLLYHFARAKELPFRTAALSFFYGLRMDLSMASYILVPVCIFVLASVFLPFFRKALVYRVYSWLVLFFILLIVISDLEVYQQWGFRIDATPLRYLNSPKEAWASISHLPLLLIFFSFLVVYTGLGFLFNRLIRRLSVYLAGRDHRILSAAAILVLTLLLIIPIRGGLQLTPLNQSSVYFSKNNFANIVAINAPWNFVHGLINKTSSKNPYQYMAGERAREIVDSMYRASGQQDSVFNTSRPNVILIVWESFTEKATHTSVDGIPVTPRFNELKKQGIYFSHAYASGDRTDKGLAAVLSGYPALNNVSVIRLPGKSAKLNTLSGFFKQKGYQTSFFYGGEPEFANIKSYILQSHYDELIEKSDFAANDLNSKWGAHDEVVAGKLFDHLAKSTQPFFATWLTLTSHEPFETPTPHVFKGRNPTTLFLNSLHYTDEVLYRFVQDCRKMPWWDNTVVVIVADHGHPMPAPNEPLENFKIPILWLGGALTHPGREIPEVVSQLDLASTLTAPLGGGRALFPFSKNLFNSSTRSWAYFSFNNGFGLVQEGRAFVFDNVGKQVIARSGEAGEQDLEAGKALQQQTYQDYTDR